MKIDDIFEEWKKDSKIDETELSTESLKTPILHAKYLEWFSKEKLLLTKFENEHKQLIKLKTEYYRGRLSKIELEEMGWEQFELKLVNKDDYQTYLEGDVDLGASLLKISLQKEKVTTLQDIIRMLHSRPYVIKNAIDYLKFTSGF